ncbi:MAG TPA: rod shape-determining protein MreC [Candidatus Cloacimonadota bacterium]|nr:rod shape-determining protein MreC [Candidatus Cloacimonadota bacterium]HPS39737.1 rod shape-determining protein MreC [Candidatus Cloacimonadota bacterium]
MAIKQYLVPIVLFVIALILVIGSAESRSAKAQWFGRTVFFPYMHSLRIIESNKLLKNELSKNQKDLASKTLENLALRNELKLLRNTETIGFETGTEDFVVAEVIGYSGQFQQRNLIVNKGLGDKIRVNDPVISSGGIVGKVVSVSDTYSVVLPFSNPLFQLPVMNKTSGVQGILNADIAGTISMNMIKLGSEVTVGDTIVSSNLSRLFPKGYPVGKISRIKESQDNLFISAEITPFALVENLEHVFILKAKYYDEQK